VARPSFSRYQSYTASRSVRNKFLKSLGKLFIALYLVLTINRVFFSSYETADGSMSPNLPEGTRFLSLRLPYSPHLPLTPISLPFFGNPKRGEIVVIRSPYWEEKKGLEAIFEELLRFVTLDTLDLSSIEPTYGQSSYGIKRLIGLPGDSLMIENHRVRIKPKDSLVYYDEIELSELDYWIQVPELPTHWEQKDPFSGTRKSFILAENEYWVLSDHRSASLDSMDYGPIQAKHFIASGSWIFWPF